ncbi:MAG: hypothetical protein A2Z16_03645 [Chloroflexi bacterium RBG_16_54_18]|nr:MAG: hypothetical protein A2Z16_03645 [Chloroflexi bacterium RBG_16_54_18]
MKSQCSHRPKRPHQINISLKAGTFLVLVLLLLLSTSTAMANMTPAQPAGGEAVDGIVAPMVTIGVAAYLAGPGSLGWAQANSVQLAVDQVNAAGGLNIGGTTYNVALVSVDGGCDSTAGAAAANALVAAGAVAVVGHVCSSACLGAQPVYYSANVPMITPSASNPAVTLQGYNTTFRLTTHDGSPVTLLANYMYNYLGIRSAATFETTWWVASGAYFESAFTALGGTVTARHLVTDPSVFGITLDIIKTENPDAIANLYLDDSAGTTAGQISDMAYDKGMEDVLMVWSSDTNDKSELLEYESAAGAAAVEGDVVIMKLVHPQDMLDWENFLSDYQAEGFANEPNEPGIFGPYAYDAAMIIMEAIDRADSTNPADIRDQIALMQNHLGVVGVYKGFDANGDMIPQWSWLVRYRSRQWLRMFPGQIFLPVLFRNVAP